MKAYQGGTFFVFILELRVFFKGHRPATFRASYKFSTLKHFTHTHSTSPSSTMPSLFTSTKSKTQQPTSRSKKHTSSLFDGRMSFDSDSSTLLNVDIPSYPTKFHQSKNVRIVTEEDMIDAEDRAWGPPPSNFWSLPKFARKTQS